MELDWAKKPIRNILLDINGVLFDSGENHAIDGSIEALERLTNHGLNFCLVTNECTTAKRLLAQKLQKLGFKSIEPEKIVSPAPVACEYLLQNELRPRLHIWDDLTEDFQPVLDKMAESSKQPNCLVVGDIMDKINRNYMDESLEIMLNCTETPTLIGLGAGRYYKDSGRLRMDTGAYIAAYEYSLGVKAKNFGKPTEAFFREALTTVGGTPDNTVMIGDDILSDVGGAQKMGMRGFLVRTGKYRKQDETGLGVIPDYTFDNLLDAVHRIIKVK